MANFSVRQIIKEHSYHILDGGVPTVSTSYTAMTIGNKWNKNIMPLDTQHPEHQFSDYSGQSVLYAVSCASCNSDKTSVSNMQFIDAVQHHFKMKDVVNDNFKQFTKAKAKDPTLANDEIIKKIKLSTIEPYDINKAIPIFDTGIKETKK